LQIIFTIDGTKQMFRVDLIFGHIRSNLVT